MEHRAAVERRGGAYAAPASVSPFGFLVRIRAGYTDSVRVTFRPRPPVAACPTP